MVKRNMTDIDGIPTDVFVYAYSWGGGWFAPRFAEALGLPIHTLLLCDAVYRSKIFPSWLVFNPTSLWGGAKIKIPANVLRVRWLYQKQDRWLKGHEPVASGPGTTIVSGVECHVGHSEMDDTPEFKSMALEIFNGALTRLAALKRKDT
jgi:hypothetical protein